MSDIAISARGIAKSYIIRHNASDHVTLAETVLHRVTHPFTRPQKELFWALNDITFDVNRGDVVGIIGRNGAGKSTLLKILSRITKPSKGEINLHGRVGSLLEVGTGFHPELTGRENIFLNGAILGMRKPEIRKHFDAIVDFSGVEQFLDTPVKRYSSGMYVRLAFAVAAHLRSEILVVDEVLAVGDAEFTRKCLGKMHDVAASGRTVLFVSHNMQSVNVLCNKAMYLEKGVCTFSGDVPTAIDHYMKSFKNPQSVAIDPQRRPGTGEYRFTKVEPAKEFFTCGDEKVIRFTINRFKPSTARLFLSCEVVSSLGAVIAQCDSRLVNFWIDPCNHFEGEFSIRTPWLKPGNYRADMYICSAGVLDSFQQACPLNVAELLPYPSTGNNEATSTGLVFGDFSYTASPDLATNERSSFEN
jgi:lipopolysaccharide transport system ATP-binding protein